MGVPCVKMRVASIMMTSITVPKVPHVWFYTYMISDVCEIIGVGYDILCDFKCFLAPARACSNAALGRLKSSPDPVQMHLGSKSSAAAARPLRLSVLFGFEIRLQWFINPLKPSWTLCPHPPHSHLPPVSERCACESRAEQCSLDSSS